MIHYYINKNSRTTLVLLHGTGADEYDLVPLAESLLPDVNILSLRGRIIEDGMITFVKRIALLDFDMEVVYQERDYILAFLKKIRKTYKLHNLIALGYSNGSTMIEALIQKEPTLFERVILLQPLLLEEGVSFTLNKELPVVVTVSNADPYLPLDRQKELLATLDASFNLTVIKHPFGHSLRDVTLKEVKKALKEA